MGEPHMVEQENCVLRWGGLGGILGGILFVLAWVVVGLGPVGLDDPANLVDWVTRFPGVQTARVIENGIYLLALILEVPLFLALYRTLRKTSLAPALIGSVVGIIGLTIYMVGALPHVAQAALSDLYHAPGASQADQAAIVLLWQATWGIFDAVLYTGFFVVPIGLIALGIGMLQAPDFGKGFGWLGIVLGALGFTAAVLQMFDPSSMIGAGSYFVCLIFYFVMGWKVFRLSRTS